jgi:hypothetical protein
MVAQQSELSFLSEDSLIFVDRTIKEAEDQIVYELISLCDLCHFTIRELQAVQRAQRKKPMHKSFLVTHTYWRAIERAWPQQEVASNGEG